MLLGLGAAVIILIFDQISKYWVLNELLGEQAGIVYTSFFNVVRAWNTGVSFSMFNDYGSLGIILLSLVAIVIVVMLLGWLFKEQNKLVQLALGFIIGGAIGNVIDRIRLGAVFDFLDFHIGESHWPAFNVADSFICIGAAIIIIESLISGLLNKKEGK